MKSGTFKLVYEDAELQEIRKKGKLSFDKAKLLPAYNQNKYEKMTMADTTFAPIMDRKARPIELEIRISRMEGLLKPSDSPAKPLYTGEKFKERNK